MPWRIKKFVSNKDQCNDSKTEVKVKEVGVFHQQHLHYPFQQWQLFFCSIQIKSSYIIHLLVSITNFFKWLKMKKWEIQKRELKTSKISVHNFLTMNRRLWGSWKRGKKSRSNQRCKRIYNYLVWHLVREKLWIYKDLSNIWRREKQVLRKDLPFCYIWKWFILKSKNIVKHFSKASSNISLIS